MKVGLWCWSRVMGWGWQLVMVCTGVDRDTMPLLCSVYNGICSSSSNLCHVHKP